MANYDIYAMKCQSSLTQPPRQPRHQPDPHRAGQPRRHWGLNPLGIDPRDQRIDRQAFRARWYERLEEKLALVGAEIERVGGD